MSLSYASDSAAAIPVASGLLQRKCACGGNPGPSGECEECRRKRMAGQPNGVQAKLRVNEPGDQWEQEADRMAETVLASASPNRGVASKAAYRPYAGGRQAVTRGDGQPLDAETRAFMEPRFGHDFSRVRIHTDVPAAQAAGELGAQAFTAGRDIVFGSRQYALSTNEGRRLLAHELTHVVQQGYSAAIPAQTPPASARVMAGMAAPQVQRNPGWSTDTLEIRFFPLDPTTPPQESYTENGFLSQRLSAKLPHYRGPFCQNTTLPFKCDVEFRLDYQDEARPQPFTPPQVSVDFSFLSSTKGGISVSKSDNNPSYGGQDMPLKTNFGTRFDLSLNGNGPFKMKFKLFDPDTGITRLYDDTIAVETLRPCM